MGESGKSGLSRGVLLGLGLVVVALLGLGAYAEIEARKQLAEAAGVCQKTDEVATDLIAWCESVAHTLPVEDGPGPPDPEAWEDLGNRMTAIDQTAAALQANLEAQDQQLATLARRPWLRPDMKKQVTRQRAAIGHYQAVAQEVRALISAEADVGNMVRALPAWIRALTEYSNEMMGAPFPRICGVEVLEMMDRGDWGGIVALCDELYPIAERFQNETDALNDHCFIGVLAWFQVTAKADLYMIRAMRKRAEYVTEGKRAEAGRATKEFMRWWDVWNEWRGRMFGQKRLAFTNFESWYSKKIEDWRPALDESLAAARKSLP